jgi:HAE1 family hydrophobic/amphiphilic exporter-1
VGVTAQQIEDALNNAYGTRQVSTIYATSNEYQVIMEVKPEFQQDPSALGHLYIHSTAPASTASQVAQVQNALAQPTPIILNSAQQPAALSQPGQTTQGRLIPLSTVATFSRGVGPLLVNHLSQLPSATISFNLQPEFL